MSPLSTEVPEPTTVALGQEDKSFPCCCVSPLSRNPPLLPSPGKHLPSSLRRDLPRLGLCQDIWEHLQSAAQPCVGLHQPAVCWNFYHQPREELPSRLRGLPAGRGGCTVQLTTPWSFSLTVSTSVLLGKSQFVTAQPVRRSPTCPLILWHSQYLQRQLAPLEEMFSLICFSR